MKSTSEQHELSEIRSFQQSGDNEGIEKAQPRLDQKNKVEQYQLLLDAIKGQDMGNIAISELSDGQVSKRILNLKDIIAIDAKGVHCCLHLTNDAPFLASRNVKYFESLLPEGFSFFRSHRSWILNLTHVSKFNN
jgi:two-component system LytT family response regulator